MLSGFDHTEGVEQGSHSESDVEIVGTADDISAIKSIPVPVSPLPKDAAFTDLVNPISSENAGAGAGPGSVWEVKSPLRSPATSFPGLGDLALDQLLAPLGEAVPAAAKVEERALEERHPVVSIVLPSISSGTSTTTSPSPSSSSAGDFEEVKSPVAASKVAAAPKPLPAAPRPKEDAAAPAGAPLAPEVEERVKTQRRLTNEWLSAPGTPPKPDLHPDVLKAMESLSKRSPRGALPALELADRDLGDIDVVALGPVSRFVPSLDLRSNRIGQRGCLAIASAATHVGSHLQRVTLKGNLGIRDEGVAVFAEALRDPSCSLTALGLGEVAMTLTGVTALAEALAANTRLESLDLRNNAIGAEGVEALARTLRTSNSTLKTLFLIRNGILDHQDRAAGCLADLLSSGTCALTHLTYDDNLLQPAGAVLIARALRANATLKYLSLRDNFVSVEAAEALRDCLKDNVSLFELDLRGNKGIRGALFAPLDTNCPKLEKLWTDPK